MPLRFGFPSGRRGMSRDGWAESAAAQASTTEPAIQFRFKSVISTQTTLLSDSTCGRQGPVMLRGLLAVRDFDGLFQ